MPFLTFEGIDGSGKSSLLKNFADYLKKQNLKVEITREPGGTPLGAKLREALLEVTQDPPCPESELLLYMADRAQNVRTKILPWLGEKKWVLGDRHGDSSVAFQGAGRQIDLSKVHWLNNFATGGLIPDLTIIVDCPVEESLKRLQTREHQSQVAADRFEREKNQFHQAVRDQYLKVAQESSRFCVVNGMQTQEKMLSDLVHECQRRLLL